MSELDGQNRDHSAELIAEVKVEAAEHMLEQADQVQAFDASGFFEFFSLLPEDLNIFLNVVYSSSSMHDVDRDQMAICKTITLSAVCQVKLTTYGLVTLQIF